MLIVLMNAHFSRHYLVFYVFRGSCFTIKLFVFYQRNTTNLSRKLLVMKYEEYLKV